MTLHVLLADTGLYVIGVIAALIALAVIAYYVARFMKGRLGIELINTEANSGQPIRGRVTLEVKKPIHGLLKVSLVGKEKRTKRRAGSGKTSQQWVEVYRQEQVLEETRDFEQGEAKHYDFLIVAPSAAEVRSGQSMLRQVAEQNPDGIQGKLLKVAATMADLSVGRIHWQIESRLDAKGVDLFTKAKCRVDLFN